MLYKSYLLENNFQSLKENLVLFYGENEGLKQEFKKKILTLGNKDEIINFDQEDILGTNLLSNEINNISLFSSRKIIIINHANDKILNEIDEIISNTSNCLIYLFADILDKKSKLRNLFEKSKTCGCVPCYQDNEITVKKLAQKSLKDFKGISNSVLSLIYSKTGNNRVKLNNELEKIKIYFTNKELRIEELEKLLDINTNDDFDLLKDEALLGNIAKTNKLLGETILETEKNIYYLFSINQRLNKIAEVKRKSAEASIEKTIDNLKPSIFWKDKPNLISQTKKWNLSKIKSVIDQTYEIELKIKSNSLINKDVLIKKLILDICCLANS